MSSGNVTLSNHWEPGIYMIGGWAPQGYLPCLTGLSCLQKQAIICILKALSSTEWAVSLLSGFPWWVSDSAFLQHPRKLKQVFPLTPRETHQSSFPLLVPPLPGPRYSFPDLDETVTSVCRFSTLPPLKCNCVLLLSLILLWMCIRARECMHVTWCTGEGQRTTLGESVLSFRHRFWGPGIELGLLVSCKNKKILTH